MELQLSYGAPSGVAWSGNRAEVRLSGSRERPTLRFRGTVKEPIALREMMGALHDVVVSDFKWRPPESRLEFERWLEGWLDRKATAERGVDASRRRFLESLFLEQRGLWTTLDPVSSVHPDQVFFEGFSKDGSAYARVGIDRSAFSETGEVVCGTTNVDFSSGLYESLRRLRSIFRTDINLTTEGVTVATGARAHTEKKIDLPDGWIRGFLQLGAAFLLDALAVELLPVHVYDICRYLRLHKAKVSPRALRWELIPGEPVRAIFEPWEHKMTFAGSSHSATEPRIVRVWGRQRLTLIERVLPLAQRFTFHLLGRGLPYFVTARAGSIDFTLGLSGWTKNDWTSTARFDALVARRGGRGSRSPRPLAWLQQNWKGTLDEVAKGTGLPPADVQASLVEAAAQGQVVYDLLHAVYRYRPLLKDPLPPGVGIGQHPEESKGREILSRGGASITGTRREVDGTTLVSGKVVEDREHVYEPWVAVADEGNVARAECGCYFAKQSKLKQGLCGHQHALLLSFDEPRG